MAEATFNDVIKSQQRYGEAQFDTARESNRILQQLLKKFEPFKKSLGNAFQEQFGTEYEKEGEKIVRTTKTISGQMKSDFDELFGSIGGSQIKDATKKVTAAFGLLKGSIQGIGLGAQSAFGFLGKTGNLLKNSKLGQTIGRKASIQGSKLKSFMNKDLGYDTTGRVFTKSGKLDKRVKGQRKQDGQGFLMKNQAVSKRQSTARLQQMLKGIRKIVPVKALRLLGKTVTFVWKMLKTRSLMVLGAIGAIVVGIILMKKFLGKKLDRLGITMANAVDRLKMFFTGKEGDKEIKKRIAKRETDYIEKYYGGEIEELNKSGDAFKTTEGLKSIFENEGFEVDLNDETWNLMVSKLDKSLQDGVTNLIDAHKSTILGTAEDIITDMNVGALDRTIRELNENDKYKSDSISLTNQKGTFEGLTEAQIKEYTDRSKLLGSVDEFVKAMRMKFDEETQTYGYQTGTETMVAAMPGDWHGRESSSTFDYGTYEEQFAKNFSKIQLKDAEEQYKQNRKDAEGNNEATKALDNLERALMGQTDASGYGKENTIDESWFNDESDKLVKIAMNHPPIVDLINEASNGNKEALEQIRQLTRDIANNKTTGEAGQMNNIVSSSSVSNNSSVVTFGMNSGNTNNPN